MSGAEFRVSALIPSADLSQVLGAGAFSAWEQSAFGRNDRGRADRSRLLREFETFCRDYPETVLMATEAGRPLGWGAREHRDHVISDLWVFPEAQRRRVGAALLAAMEDAIANEGFGYVELETFTGNPGAVRFYERHGYSAVWRGVKFTASLNYELDKIRFRKPLTRSAIGLPET